MSTNTTVKQDWDIEWINDVDPTVQYEFNEDADFDAEEAKYTAKFEKKFGVSNGDDIGGLIVYSDNCVYDYENFCGWFRK